MKLETVSDIHELLSAPFASAALSAALQQGLFWRLADQPRSTAEIAQEMKIPHRRCRYWLRLLVSLNLLEQEGDRFWISTLTRSAILNEYTQESWKLLAIDADENLEDSLSLAQRLREPIAPQDPVAECPDQLDPYVQKMAQDLDRARLFCQTLYELHMPLAQEVAAVLDMDGARTLMDLGGGSGVMSFALLRKHPSLKATLIDIPNVCQASREIAAKLPERDRISYHTANFVEDDLPKGFDIVMVCDVGFLKDTTLAKLVVSLNMGGRLVIVDRWFDKGQEETSERLSYLLSKSIRNPEFYLKSLPEFLASLERYGLETKPVEELAYNQWKMIVSQKKVPVGMGHQQGQGLPSLPGAG